MEHEKLPRLLLVKQDFLTCGFPCFSGGKHAFRCMAASLAASGHSVAVLCQATQQQVMLEMLEPSLEIRKVGAMAAGGASGPVKVTEDIVSFSGHSSGHSLYIQTVDGGSPLASRLQRLGAALEALKGIEGPDLVILDADDCYESGNAEADYEGSRMDEEETGAGVLLRRAAESCRGRLIVLVQNVHFLPFGPHGCSSRTRAAEAAWRSLVGCVAVSEFVASYVRKWEHNLRGGRGPVPLLPVLFVPLAAFGVFGMAEKIEDYGQEAVAASRLRRNETPEDGHEAAAASSSAEPRPVVLQPKLSDVKGARIFYGLAAALPEVDFVGVVGDKEQETKAAVQLPGNVRLREPGAISDVLRGASVVICPSVWQEAFGMTVVESLARGLPVLASDVGGHKEAKLGTGYLLPVAPITLSGSGCELSSDEEQGISTARHQKQQPRWDRRVVPQQEIEPWAAALRRLLLDDGCAEVYRQESSVSRSRAMDHIRQGHQGQERAVLSSWMQDLIGDKLLTDGDR